MSKIIRKKANYTLLFLAVFLFLALNVSAKIVSAQSSFDLMFKSSSQYKDVVVQEVVNVDTIIIENMMKKGETIKLIGVRGPKEIIKKKEEIERDQFGFIKQDKAETPITPLDDQAIEFATDLLEGKHVRLEFDSDKKSDDFKTLAYVFLIEDNTFVNVEILRQGFGYLQISPPNTKYAKDLRNAYKEARREKRGYQGEY